ncbi:MAG: hypothetical protein ACREBU_20775 [Nitrososphaera sp.]
MKKIWLGCPNCHLAFYDELEYGHHFKLDHPKKKFVGPSMLESQTGY